VSYPRTCHNDAKLKTRFLYSEIKIVQLLEQSSPTNLDNKGTTESVLIKQLYSVSDISYMEYGIPKQANKQDEHLLERPVECG